MLRLDPGMAFGTGLHPTTKSALALALPRVHRGDAVLDIGCGSGILGLAAALHGARVYASDSDTIAVRVARANFATNVLPVQRIVRARDVPAKVPQAALITANITGRVLARLSTALARKLKPRGWLISSGIVESGKAYVLRSYARAGLRHAETIRDGEWLAFAHQKSRR